MSMIEVHHLNNSRSQRVLWLLEELALPYTIVRYQRDATTMLAPPSLKAIHPLGKSPVIRDGERVIAESGAILEYLTERHGEGRLVPARNSEAYERYRYWMHYAEGSLMTQLLLRLYLGRLGDPARAVFDRVESTIRTHLDFVEGQLGSNSFLAGDTLSAADIQMSFPLELSATQKLLAEQQPGLKALLARMHARPAYQRALEKGGPYAYAND
jgi:glutathione S-transferase